MANEVLIKVGTYLVWADDDGDFGDSPIPATDQITLAALANAAARQGDKGDFTAKRARRYSVTLRVELDVAPASGAVVDLYWAPSVSAAAGTANPGGVVGVDGAYTGTAGDSLVDSLKQLDFIGSLICTSDAAIVVQQQTFVFSPSDRYGTPVVHNQSGQAFEGDDIEMSIIFTPLVDEVQ